jgi:hypothetical protein
MAMTGPALWPAIGAVASLTATASEAAAVGFVAVDAASIGLALGSAAYMDAGNDAMAGRLALASSILGVIGLGGALGPAVVAQAGKGIKTFTAATRYVRPSPVRPPLALKAPRLRGGGDITGIYRREHVPRTFPEDGEILAMTGVERVNAAIGDAAMRAHMVSRGFVSPQLLRQLPDGIDVADRWSVMRARYVLTQALREHDGLNPGVLARSGFSENELASLNPSRAGGAYEPTDADLRFAEIARRENVPESGEHIYRLYLDTGDETILRSYALALARARTDNRWANWNAPLRMRRRQRR